MSRLGRSRRSRLHGPNVREITRRGKVPGAVALQLQPRTVADITQPSTSATPAELMSRFGDLFFPAFNRPLGECVGGDKEIKRLFWEREAPAKSLLLLRAGLAPYEIHLGQPLQLAVNGRLAEIWSAAPQSILGQFGVEEAEQQRGAGVPQGVDQRCRLIVHVGSLCIFCIENGKSNPVDER